MSASIPNKTRAMPKIVITEFYEPTLNLPASNNQDPALLSSRVPHRSLRQRQQADEVTQQTDNGSTKHTQTEVIRLIGRSEPTVVDIDQEQPIPELEEQFLEFFEAPNSTAPPSALTRMFLRQFRTRPEKESDQEDDSQDDDQAIEEEVDPAFEDNAVGTASGPSTLPISSNRIIDLLNPAAGECPKESATSPSVALPSLNTPVIDLTGPESLPASFQRSAIVNEQDAHARSRSPAKTAPAAPNQLKRKRGEEEDEGRDGESGKESDEENKDDSDEETDEENEDDSDEETDEETDGDSDEDQDDAEDDDEFEQADDEDDEDFEIQKRGPKRAKVSRKPTRIQNSSQPKRTCAQIAADAGRPNWQMVYKRCRPCKENGLRCDPSHPGSVPVKGRLSSMA